LTRIPTFSYVSSREGDKKTRKLYGLFRRCIRSILRTSFDHPLKSPAWRLRHWPFSTDIFKVNDCDCLCSRLCFEFMVVRQGSPIKLKQWSYI